MPSPWVWAATSHQYRNTATGQYIGPKGMLALRDTYTEAKIAQARVWASQVSSGQMTLTDWQTAMRTSTKNSYIDQYVLGHGGRGSMTPTDWGRIGAEVKEQYKYLDGFTDDIASGKLSEAQIGARSELYHNSATASYERGNAYARGLPRLPYYPGDGASECKANCRCHWDIRDSERGGWDCYWILGGEKPCQTCGARSASYNPLHVEA